MEVQMEHVFEEKDLGIIIDPDLAFDVHASKKIKKANNMLGLLVAFCSVDGAGVGDGECWVFEAEQGLQVQSLFLRYCAVFNP